MSSFYSDTNFSPFIHALLSYRLTSTSSLTLFIAVLIFSIGHVWNKVWRCKVQPENSLFKNNFSLFTFIKLCFDISAYPPPLNILDPLCIRICIIIFACFLHYCRNDYVEEKNFFCKLTWKKKIFSVSSPCEYFSLPQGAAREPEVFAIILFQKRPVPAPHPVYTSFHWY